MTAQVISTESYLYIFGIIAAFILLTASINYINLATARSLKRAKEIGVRKVLGAYRKQLTIQYITESLILTFIAFFLALALGRTFNAPIQSTGGQRINLSG